jgi:hypothetical protein
MDWTPKDLEFESQYRDDYSHLHVIQTCPEAHNVSCSIGMGALPMGLMDGVMKLTTHLHLVPK